ncbi:hypothetical protein GNZ12_19580 [Paraburkholderia sp. 1N]|uniref:Fis family transcriptional regulator n=1 Tax=Paraburkholderia solitsugae TaxID=2675748 RepID=A0ABX2BU14_9BURK|nr:hypothetical protein [Paraburkholderia solitsugae]NPT43468.1 hypothetical protein [Paraburkholderia solitsugae]
MTKEKKAKRSAPGRSVRWPKHMLLPLTAYHVDELSLASHLALVTCRSEEANRHMFNELIRITYLSFFLWETGYGEADIDAYIEAEHVLDEAVLKAERRGTWRLDDQESEKIERVIRIYDFQIGAITGKVFAEARLRLEHLIRDGYERSPVADFVRERLYSTHAVNAESLANNS